MFSWYPVMDLARAPRRAARKKGSGYENDSKQDAGSDCKFSTLFQRLVFSEFVFYFIFFNCRLVVAFFLTYLNASLLTYHDQLP
jgi:hypothetical protein